MFRIFIKSFLSSSSDKSLPGDPRLSEILDAHKQTCELTFVFFLNFHVEHLTPLLPGPWRRGGRPLRRKGPVQKGGWAFVGFRRWNLFMVRLASSRGWMMTMSGGLNKSWGGVFFVCGV